jgi:membrane protein implicated in regulation of membrane protease activity
MTASILWLLTGAMFLALEAFGIPGIGLLFIGLGAILTGLFIEIGIIASDAYVMQFAALFINSSILAVLLWKKVKQFRGASGKAGNYQNMIGDEATVIGLLTHNHKGQVSWSGTTMIAELAAGEPDLAEGASAIITEVNGNVLTVKGK